MKLFVNYKEAIELFERWKRLSNREKWEKTPILTIYHNNNDYAYITVRLGGYQTESFAYKKKWLFARTRIKHYIKEAEKLPYGDIRIIKK